MNGYLKQMARVTSALEFFSENNPHSVELATLVSLFQNGHDYKLWTLVVSDIFE